MTTPHSLRVRMPAGSRARAPGETTSVHRPDGTVDLIVKGKRARTVKRGDVLLTVAPTGQHYRAEVREVRSRKHGKAVCQTTGIIVNQPPRNVPNLSLIHI